MMASLATVGGRGALTIRIHRGTSQQFGRPTTPAPTQRQLNKADAVITRRDAFTLLAMLGPTTVFGLAAEADTGESASSFYAQWPYVQPADILPFLRATCKPGDPNSVLVAIDQFASYYPFYRSGPEKGRVLEELVAAQAPLLAIELGTFMAYGAIRIARALPPGGRLISIEADAQQAAVAKEVLSLAGFGPPQVEVVQGLSSDVLPHLAQQLAGQQAGFIFLDHCKPCYLPDLQAMEALDMVREGTVAVADNVIFPGTPDYLRHVQAPEGAVAAASASAGGTVAQAASPGGRGSRGRGGSSQAAMRRQFLYDTQLVEAAFEVEQRYKEGWQPQQDAMAVSRCLGLAPEQ